LAEGEFNPSVKLNAAASVKKFIVVSKLICKNGEALAYNKSTMSAANIMEPRQK
jgi:hypothetical protein